MSAAVLPSIRPTFRAVAATVIPETIALDATAWATLETAVERALAARPEPMRRQLALFVRVLEYLPLFTVGGRFSRLGPVPRQRVLKSLESSRSLLIRRGVWGLRTLILLGYYSQAEIQVRIGYRAHPDGWSARRQSADHPAAPAEA